MRRPLAEVRSQKLEVGKNTSYFSFLNSFTVAANGYVFAVSICEGT